MQKSKYIKIICLLFAWAIIFTHNVVPHHHHFEEIKAEQEHCHDHSHEVHQHLDHTCDLKQQGFNECSHEDTGHACHFHVDVLTKVTVDNIFIINKENPLFANIDCNEISNTIYYIAFVSDQIPKTNHLRGPPVFS